MKPYRSSTNCDMRDFGGRYRTTSCFGGNTRICIFKNGKSCSAWPFLEGNNNSCVFPPENPFKFIRPFLLRSFIMIVSLYKCRKREQHGGPGYLSGWQKVDLKYPGKSSPRPLNAVCSTPWVKKQKIAPTADIRCKGFAWKAPLR